RPGGVHAVAPPGPRRKPEASVRSGGQRPRGHLRLGRELGELAARGDATERTRFIPILGYPEVPVGAGGDFERPRVIWQLEHLDRPARDDPSHLVFLRFGEPDVAVGPDRKPGGETAGPRQFEL